MQSACPLAPARIGTTHTPQAGCLVACTDFVRSKQQDEAGAVSRQKKEAELTGRAAMRPSTLTLASVVLDIAYSSKAPRSDRLRTVQSEMESGAVW